MGVINGLIGRQEMERKMLGVAVDDVLFTLSNALTGNEC